MTTLIAWVSVDAAGVSALNIGTDSRFSWSIEESSVFDGVPRTQKKITSVWDGGKKLFFCRNTTDFFGFSGRVDTPSAILSQIVDAIDCGVINLNGLSPIKRHEHIQNIFRNAYQELDVSQRKGIALLHGYRASSERNSVFHLWETGCADGSKSWIDNKKNLPKKESAIVASCGSGGVNPGNKLSEIQKQFGNNVSSIVQSFNKSLQSESDKYSGGFLQLIKIDRFDHCAQPVGLAFDGRRLFLGRELGVHGVAGSIEWRDKDYTFLDGETLQPMSGAKDQSFRSKQP